MLKYQEGDLFKNIKGKSRIVIPHVCNNIGAFSSGFVVPLGRTFPMARQFYLDWFKHGGRADSCDAHYIQHSTGNFELGQTQFVSVGNEVVVANMLAQHGIGGPHRPLRYNALAKCMDQVADWMPTWAIDPHYEIHAPLFGSERSMGNWNFITELIQDCWVRRDINVTIHYLPGSSPEGIKTEI